MNSAGFTRAWYAQEALRDLVLIYPVYAIMIGETGVRPVELAWLFAAWSTTALLFEVPSGTLADRWPRRTVIVAGLILKAACFLIWWLAPSFGGFLAGFIFWGIGGSLRSGAAEALLHDKLHELGTPKLFVRVYGRGQAIGAIAVVLAMALGGWAAQSGYTVPLILSWAAPLAAALVTLTIVEPPRTQSASHGEAYLATLAAGVREVATSVGLRRPVVYLCTAALAYEVGEEYFGPLLVETGLSLVAVGLVTAFTCLARAAGALIAERLHRWPSSAPWLYTVAGVSLVAATLGPAPLTVAALGLFAALTATAKVQLQGQLQQAIAGHARATVTSVVGFGQNLLSLPLYLALGALAGSRDWSASFLLLGVGLCVVAQGLGFGLPRRER